MQNEIKQFVEQARAKGLNDNDIRQKLVIAGWKESDINSSLSGDLIVPSPPSAPQSSTATGIHDANNPLPVVQNLSTRGFEYSIMFLALWASALSIAGLLQSLASRTLSSGGYRGGSLDVFWTTILVVFAPVLAFMFLRLKKFETKDPTLLKDPSRRKLSHITQLITFLIGVGYLVFFIYSLVSGNIGGQNQMSAGELVVHVLITLAITGPIFAYYWREEHKLIN